jgi:hypothetical protein
VDLARLVVDPVPLRRSERPTRPPAPGATNVDPSPIGTAGAGCFRACGFVTTSSLEPGLDKQVAIVPGLDSEHPHLAAGFGRGSHDRKCRTQILDGDTVKRGIAAA